MASKSKEFSIDDHMQQWIVHAPGTEGGKSQGGKKPSQVNIYPFGGDFTQQIKKLNNSPLLEEKMSYLLCCIVFLYRFTKRKRKGKQQGDSTTVSERCGREFGSTLTCSWNLEWKNDLWRKNGPWSFGTFPPSTLQIVGCKHTMSNGPMAAHRIWVGRPTWTPAQMADCLAILRCWAVKKHLVHFPINQRGKGIILNADSTATNNAAVSLAEC